MAKIPERKLACIDACFILGDFRKLAREYKKSKRKRKKGYCIEIRPDKRLRDILGSGTNLFITPITKYNILETLIFGGGLSFKDSKNVYLAIYNKYQNLREINGIDGKILTNDFINRALSKLQNEKIDLHDVLNIDIARAAEMPIITSERKVEVWKTLYNKVLNQEQAWELFKG